ncbi:fibroin heavy chain isoform X1 [Cephus cinctus]|uniref:Fibroin heavy chain isoform X1 n=1 Tax=Cephus cinctus TaxID=211228 RepID=A0AAJ7C3G5_CEPCN|nr:fibroin heavy chain isoform X1 [Cephus cinctus]
MGVRICILLTVFSAVGILSEDRLPQYRQVRSRQPFPSLALKDLFADELDVEGPIFATKPQKRDVSHVLSGTAKSPSGAASGAGSFASSGSFAGSSSFPSKSSVGTQGGYTGGGTGAGYAGAGTGGGSGYSGIGTSYTPNSGFQDYYSNQNQASSYPYYPSQNIVPYFGPGFDFQNFLQQYFSNLQAQQEAFQAQLQAQQQAAASSWAGSGAYMTNPDGTIDPNARVHSYSHSTPGMAVATSAVQSDSGYGGSYSSSRGNRFFEMNNRLGYGFPYAQQIPNTYAANTGSGFGGAAGGFGSPAGGYSGSASGSGPHVATASANLGPQGGHQSASISPAAPGIFSRFGESVPPPSGNSFGVFTSSSSGHSVGPDGKETSYKSATTGVNDNGKVSYHTVRDP